MSRDNAPPMPRGATLYAGRTPDAANLEFEDVIGREHHFEDVNWNYTGGSAKPTLSGLLVLCRLVRNVSGAAVAPKRLVTVDPTRPGEITGYTTTVNTDNVAVVDEYLPSAGCPDDDVCWVVLKGPTTCITPHTGDFAAAIVAGDWLVSATTSATFHGRPISAQTVTTNNAGSPTTASTDSLSKATRNKFGKAMAAALATAVDTDLRVLMRPDH